MSWFVLLVFLGIYTLLLLTFHSIIYIINEIKYRNRH